MTGGDARDPSFLGERPRAVTDRMLDLNSVQPIIGDGNCLFRALSCTITGSEDDHQEVREQIVDFMQNNGPMREALKTQGWATLASGQLKQNYLEQQPSSRPTSTSTPSKASSTHGCSTHQTSSWADDNPEDAKSTSSTAMVITLSMSAMCLSPNSDNKISPKSVTRYHSGYKISRAIW